MQKGSEETHLLLLSKALCQSETKGGEWQQWVWTWKWRQWVSNLIYLVISSALSLFEYLSCWPPLISTAHIDSEGEKTDQYSKSINFLDSSHSSSSTTTQHHLCDSPRARSSSQNCMWVFVCLDGTWSKQVNSTSGECPRNTKLWEWGSRWSLYSVAVNPNDFWWMTITVATIMQ